MIAQTLRRFRRRSALLPRDGRQTLADRALAHRLFQTFEYDLELAGLRGIHFYVQSGTVTLYGTVRHRLDRDLLVSLVEQIEGVRGVVEHLQIVDPPFQETGGEITLQL